MQNFINEQEAKNRTLEASLTFLLFRAARPRPFERSAIFVFVVLSLVIRENSDQLRNKIKKQNKTARKKLEHKPSKSNICVALASTVKGKYTGR